MKLTTLTAVAMLFGAAGAYAADTTPGPVGKGDAPTPYPSTSGRPSAILDDSQCQNVWQQAMNSMQNANANSMQNSDGNQKSSSSTSGSNNQASSDTGGTLSADQATPYIVNFAMVDKDSNGKISKTEFQNGCKSGWVQAAVRSDKLNMQKSGSVQSSKSGS